MSIGAKRARAWDQWEGQLVDSKFRLLKYLGGSERSAVFLTERPQGEPPQAAIKIVPADDVKAKAQLARWQASARLSHPHLIRLFEMGRTQFGGTSFAYLVMEYAEEDLSQVDRPLTAAEASDMLEGTLKALAYLHGQRLAHGHLKPSNIMAVADGLKVSSDTIRPTGEWRADLDSPQPCDPPEIVDEGASAAGDVWSLGITLVEAVTKHLPLWETGASEASLPPGLPSVFHEPASNCLRRDPGLRWTAADFARFLRRDVDASLPSRPESPGPKYVRQRYLIVAGVVGLTLAAAAIIPRMVSQRAAPPPPIVEPARPEPVTNQPPAEKGPTQDPDKAKVQEPPAKAVVQQTIVKQVLPAVPAKARDTIRGRVTIRIRVNVDAAGSVVDAKNESPAASRYFGNLALQAARQWKFAPANSNASSPSRAWSLRFQFVRDARRPVSVQALPAR